MASAQRVPGIGPQRIGYLSYTQRVFASLTMENGMAQPPHGEALPPIPLKEDGTPMYRCAVELDFLIRICCSCQIQQKRVEENLQAKPKSCA